MVGHGIWLSAAVLEFLHPSIMGTAPFYGCAVCTVRPVCNPKLYENHGPGARGFVLCFCNILFSVRCRRVSVSSLLGICWAKISKIHSHCSCELPDLLCAAVVDIHW